LDVIILDTPHDDVIEVSSSLYDLSLFSLKASSGHIVGEGTVPGKMTSESIGDLSPEISSTGNVGAGGSFVAAAYSQLEASSSHRASGAGRVMTKRSSCSHGSSGLDPAPEQAHVAGSSRGASRRRGGGAAKNKVARILDESRRGTCSDISPRTKRLFVELQYLPSTAMD
jgi:hypothetical protein